MTKSVKGTRKFNRETFRILAKDCLMSNDSRKTGLNGNDLVIGPSGAGKTRSYVMPNIMQANESMVIADTKGNLVNLMGPFLKMEGYRVELIDFKEMSSTCRYNPLEYISYDEKSKEYSTRDILKVAATLLPITCDDDPFWDESGRKYMSLLISLVLKFTPREEHSLRTVMKLFREMSSDDFKNKMDRMCSKYPDCYAAQIYQEIRYDQNANRTYQCILMTISTAMANLTFDSALAMYDHPNHFRFRDLGREKTALFLNISDTDRSLDILVSLLYTQALQDLCNFADHECAGEHLPVPVRFLMDDFATNSYIEDFDKIISVIRSREISVSIIIQSLNQLYSMYGTDRAGTIIDNTDNLLYLGGHSMNTVDYIAKRANVSFSEVMDMKLGEAWLFTSGRPARKVSKFILEEHKRYREIFKPSETKIKHLPDSDVLGLSQEIERDKRMRASSC